MVIFKHDFNLENANGCVLAFGNFDGVHIGHIHLLKKAAEYARKNGFAFGVFTFVDSPKFRNAEHSLLSRFDERISSIEAKVNPDFLYLECFDDVKDFTPEEFVEYIIKKFDCRCTFCGENFRFGNSASGDSSLLKSLMHRVGRCGVVVESVYDGKDLVSSTLVKSLLTQGDVLRASKLLSEPYGFVSKVVHGAHLGHSLGFPTINQIIPKELVCPKFGVYSTVVVIDSKRYIGVTNFGVKPTVSTDNTPVAETYVIDFDGDVYGQNIGVYFYKMLREERKFCSLDELKENISINVEQTKKMFGDKYEKA